jgi:hypothetical protein
MQSGKKRKTTDTLERARDKAQHDPSDLDYPRASLMTNRLDDIKSHIKVLESKLDLTKHLIRAANQMTQDFQERHSNVPPSIKQKKESKKSIDSRLKIQIPVKTVEDKRVKSSGIYTSRRPSNQKENNKNVKSPPGQTYLLSDTESYDSSKRHLKEVQNMLHTPAILT